MCSLGHELCHSVRMSDSPGQGLVLFVCPQLGSDKDWLLSLLSKEDMKAGPRQEGRLCPVEAAGPACPSLAPTASTEKPVSPPRAQFYWSRENGGVQKDRHLGLWETVGFPPGLQGARRLS